MAAYNAPYQQNMYGGMPQMPQRPFMPQMPEQPGLTIVPINSDDQVTNYPVAAGNTVVFVNFNTNRMCFKSTNANCVAMPLRWATFAYDDEQRIQQTQLQPQNQNVGDYVTRAELDELKALMQQTLSAVTENNQPKQGNQQNKQGRG